MQKAGRWVGGVTCVRDAGEGLGGQGGLQGYAVFPLELPPSVHLHLPWLVGSCAFPQAHLHAAAAALASRPSAAAAAPGGFEGALTPWQQDHGACPGILGASAPAWV
eukprot:1149496-Pelagomonas_calceolata.AAC.6